MIDMDYWTEHHYSGHIFLIKSDEPPSKWDGYCQFILQYRTIFGCGWTPDTVEAIQPPTDAVRFNNIAASGRVKSERASKPRSGVSKVIPPVSKEKPLEGHTKALETKEQELYRLSKVVYEDHPAHDGISLFDQGFYHDPCKVCAKPIARSGKRGRPRTIHKECR